MFSVDTAFVTANRAARTVALMAAVAFGTNSASAQQTIRAGTFLAGGPFTLFDETTRLATGATSEILQAIAADAGMSLEFVPVTGSGSNPFVAAFEAGQIDVIAYTFQITDARLAQFDFTDPVFSYGEIIAVNQADLREYRTAADLRGRSVGVVAGSSYVDLANSVGAVTRVGDSLPGAMDEVNAGRYDAAMGTAPVVIYRVEQQLHPNVRVPGEYRSDAALDAGFGVKRGQAELLAALNASLARLVANGTVREIATRWGVENLLVQ